MGVCFFCMAFTTIITGIGIYQKDISKIKSGIRGMSLTGLGSTIAVAGYLKNPYRKQHD